MSTTADGALPGNCAIAVERARVHATSAGRPRIAFIGHSPDGVRRWARVKGSELQARAAKCGAAMKAGEGHHLRSSPGVASRSDMDKLHRHGGLYR